MSESRESIQKPVVGITIGDINGIGPEIIIKALSDERILNHILPVIYGSSKAISYYRKNLRFDDFQYAKVNAGDRLHSKKVNIINCWEDMVEINTGSVTPEAGNCSRLALEKATDDLKNGAIQGLVTAPINKDNIQSKEFSFPGHTEYLTRKFGASQSLMLMISEKLKLGVVTGHLPLKKVSKAITKDLLKKKIAILEKTLINDFGIQKPKIAVLGLNPHAGEEGLLGKEEVKVIRPVIGEFKEKGKLIYGPYPADGFFGTFQQLNFDATLAMYHDQGLIPFKSMAFESGVNYTAGLPVVRTSPDHGTGYSIAGKNEASPTSLMAAIYLCSDIIRTRNEVPVAAS